jgi:cleavage and polyadenylation specificity factor subunit 1
MVLLPRTTAPTSIPPVPNAAADAADATIPSSQILISSTTGSLALLSTLSETQYRKLNTLTTTLSNSLYHACGLNPRAYRIGKDPPEAMVGGRNVVDGTMLMRWAELGSQKRAEVAGRVGVDVEEVREDLRVLRGGLGYL